MAPHQRQSELSGLPQGILDADNHYYEPDDCFARHIDPEFSDRAINIRRGEDGVGYTYFGDEPLYYLPKTPLDRIGKPGVVADNRDGRYAPLGEEDIVRPGEIPWFVDRDARLGWMDDQDVSAVLLWPSLGLTVENQMRSDPQACIANLNSFNRWLDDDWGYRYKDRLFGVPTISLIDLDAACREADRVIAAGARVIGMLFAPVNNRSIADPYFDPFWARLNEAGVAIGFHGAESGYNELLSWHWGENKRPSAAAQSPFQRASFFGERPIMDTLAALVLHNLFGRFPGLSALSIENGSVWVSYLLRVMDKGFHSGQYGEWLGGRFSDLPSDIFREHVYVAPNDDDDIRELIDLIGVERVLLGSDYPHPEGIAEPRSFLKNVELTDSETECITRANLYSVLEKAGPVADASQ